MACLRNKCLELKCAPVAVGGIADHVHVLVRISPVISPSELVRQLKGVSSHLVNTKLDPESAFKWQGGYGAFSVSPNHVEKVRRYVENQARHHAENSVIQNWEKWEEEVTL
jgi:REP element-mobilizing transposase RayT